jgi:hypothetical protein
MDYCCSELKENIKCFSGNEEYGYWISTVPDKQGWHESVLGGVKYCPYCGTRLHGSRLSTADD